MSDIDASGVPDGRKTLGSMGWVQLPYGCTGIARRAEVPGGKSVWSWLILIPWARADAKPWVDGTELFGLTLDTVEQQREKVLQKMRGILDKRYGETVAGNAADQLIQDLQRDD